jgi:hypothetical protein
MPLHITYALASLKSAVERILSISKKRGTRPGESNGDQVGHAQTDHFISGLSGAGGATFAAFSGTNRGRGTSLLQKHFR